MSSTDKADHFCYVVSYLAYDGTMPKSIVYRAYSHSEPAVKAAEA